MLNRKKSINVIPHNACVYNIQCNTTHYTHSSKSSHNPFIKIIIIK